MKVTNEYGKEIAPCIVSKVKHALKLKDRWPTNDKKCSKVYWENTCELVGKADKKTSQEIDEAKKLFNKYI
jgi:hypothetical protein